MKVVLGMSGGVDSSVAALLLKKKGFQVQGIFMKNFSGTKNFLTGECNWRDEWRMAQKIALLLQIPLELVDYEKQYRSEVVDKMFSDYSKGLTPNPDILCNKIIKFPALFKAAKRFNADFVATGHYAKIKRIPNNKLRDSNDGKGFQLFRPKDKSKDQTYFLYELTDDQLKKIIFPIGEMNKQQVRELAHRNKFPNWDKKGTSGVCFIGKVDFKKFLGKKIKSKKGMVLSPEGKIIGVHNGANFLTIGERVGESKSVFLDSEWKKSHKGKIYVAEKIKNDLIVAPENHSILKRREAFLRRFHSINPEEIVNNKVFMARIRHLGEFHRGVLKKIKSERIFLFDKGIEGLARGQSLVIYSGNRVVGGGEIFLR